VPPLSAQIVTLVEGEKIEVTGQRYEDHTVLTSIAVYTHSSKKTSSKYW